MEVSEFRGRARSAHEGYVSNFLCSCATRIKIRVAETLALGCPQRVSVMVFSCLRFGPTCSTRSSAGTSEMGARWRPQPVDDPNVEQASWAILRTTPSWRPQISALDTG